MFKTIKSKAKALGKIYVTGLKMSWLQLRRIFKKVDPEYYNREFWRLVKENLDASLHLIGCENDEGAKEIIETMEELEELE